MVADCQRQRMSKRNFIAGFVCGSLLSCFAAVVVTGIWIWTRPGDESGGGKHLDSPDGGYKAVAMNMYRRNLSGEVRKYYSLRVLSNSNEFEISRYEFPMPKDSVWFREGTGSIIWEADSSMVRFGTQDEVIWSYVIDNPAP